MSAHYTHVGAEALEKAVAALPGNLKGIHTQKANDVPTHAIHGSFLNNYDGNVWLKC